MPEKQIETTVDAPDVKPGWKCSEFYMHALPVVIDFLMKTGICPQANNKVHAVSSTVALASVIAYGFWRTRIKHAAIAAGQAAAEVFLKNLSAPAPSQATATLGGGYGSGVKAE